MGTWGVDRETGVKLERKFIGDGAQRKRIGSREPKRTQQVHCVCFVVKKKVFGANIYRT